MDENYILHNIQNLDTEKLLHNQQLSESLLSKILHKLNIVTVAKTQLLSQQFIDDYLSDPKYAIEAEEQYLTLVDVQEYQKRLANK